MAKKRTPEQEAIRAAKKRPEKRFHFSRRMSWGWGDRPCKWGFFTNWTSFTIDIGEPKVKFHGPEVPESKFGFTVATRPFSIICFWERKRLFWIGDWEWKKGLSNSRTS
jgi:hypothetical protein